MSFRTFVVATVVAAGLASVWAAPAHADDILLCTPIGLWPWCSRQRITCGQGARYVDRIGFNTVRAVDCHRPIFRYRGLRSGDWWFVRMDSRTGRIVSVYPARPL